MLIIALVVAANTPDAAVETAPPSAPPPSAASAAPPKPPPGNVAIVHTGEPGALDAARIAEQHLKVKLYEPLIAIECARDGGCPVRPAEKHLLIVSAREGGAIHLELVDVFGAPLVEEDVAAPDPSLLQAALAPALERVKAKVPGGVDGKAALPPPDAGGSGWLIAGAVVGGGCALVTGALLVGALGEAGARFTEQVVQATCGAACGELTSALCTAPAAACTGAFSSLGDSCSSSVDVCSGIDCAGPSCDIPTPSCDVPTPNLDCNVGSCALPVGSAPLGMQGLERQPTEDVPAAGQGMAY